ncbi:MAG TPA: flagellar biosynthetic protein FliR [Patescibacteria group bacterium]|nr:flagellar biosynthetic protein FliR [Patescibacteria group bacterium]
MLNELLSTDIFKLMLVFSRLGMAMMLIPGIGGTLIPARARMLLAVVISFLLLPVLGPQLPGMPQDLSRMFLLLLGEVTVGLFFGVLTQILMSSLDLAGNFIGYSAGLTNAFVFDPVSESQSQLITGFLNTAAISLVFVTNTHHLMLRALVDTYGVFTPGQPLPFEDMSVMLVSTAGKSFTVGIQLASPLVVFSLVFNTGLGMLNRLVPQMQVFFVGMPLQIMVGLGILMVSLPAIMFWFMRHLTEGIGVFLAPG